MDTKQQHTAEPWEILDEGDVLEINNGTEAVTSDVFDSSKDPKREKVLRDFRRIVACVNACAGFETEELEQEPTRIIDLLDKALPAIQQRDKLLAALKALLQEFGETDAIGQQDPLYIARAIIAEIEAAK